MTEKIRFYLIAAACAFVVGLITTGYRWSVGRCVLPSGRVKAVVHFASLQTLNAFMGVIVAYACMEHFKLDLTATFIAAALTGSIGKDVFELLTDALYHRIQKIVETFKSK